MSAHLMQRSDTVMATTYARTPVVFTEGEGCQLRDAEGKTYWDFLAGIAVCNLGHAHPAVANALASQARKLVHVSNLFYTEPQVALAEWLTSRSFGDRVFFANSGAEANEAAIKLARKYFAEKGEPARYRIITMEKSFHGRTMATLSATGQEKVRIGFDPTLNGFDYVPFNNLDAVKAAIGPETCAIMVEPVQGEGGVRMASPGYFQELRALCDAAGILLIMDEIQTGMGRTGRLFAYEHTGVAPDIMTLAKALANGLPIGAMVARETVAAAFVPGSHGSTFGGTPLICAGALATVETLETEDLVRRSRETGAYFLAKLETLMADHPKVTAVRGIGLMLAMEFSESAGHLVDTCREAGFIINCIQDRILRFVPPLTIPEAAIDDLVACLDAALA
ncbi:MAG: aspartate aminotransferase family protein [Deltaproteobacteria bacterium]|nr:MAG: aspartate aminotransferase family protein [Deltaproteobacteria bacterium]